MSALLVSTHPFPLFDYFRVPYRIEPEEQPLGRLHGARGEVRWPAAGADGPRGLWFVAGNPVYATLAEEATLAAWRRDLGGSWQEVAAIVDAGGRKVSAVARSDEGTLLIPFDTGDAMVSCWSEAHTTEAGAAKSGVKRFALSGYYAVRPVLPRAAQLALRRAFSRIQARTAYPRWPVESGLHDLYELLFDWLAAAAGAPLPALAPWPDGKHWALVLTHDVEHEAGYRSIPVMRDLELSLGYGSAWYLVPERDYRVDDETVEELRSAGFEVGVHGLRHDGRDLVPSAFEERLPAIQSWRDRWRSAGFRAPATHRSWELMPRLGFEYDTSSFDTDPFEPQSGGCCTWLPFHNGELVELPLTLTMDHTVFVILRRDGSMWEEKADLLRNRGGMAMALTHPDYMTDGARLAAYERFLRRYAEDDTAWRALPHEVCAWWRRRAESRIEESADGMLAIVGPAAGEARIVQLGAAR